MPDPSQQPPQPPIQPSQERPALSDLTDHGLLKEQVKTAWETLDLLRTLQSLFPSQDPSPALSTEIPANPQAGPTTPTLLASLSELQDHYRIFKNDVLNCRIEVDAEDSALMNRLDVAFDSTSHNGEIPEQLKSVSGNGDFEVLANGTKVPRYLIEVLNDFDKIWPGASFYNARPALVGQILTAQNAKTPKGYPFCLNDDAGIPDKGSPCILRKGHRGRHKDNDDGSWA